MIPIRVPFNAKPGLIGPRRFVLDQGHHMYDSPCPVCDEYLGGGPEAKECVLVLVGIAPMDRKGYGFTNGGAVLVHSECAGVK